MFAPVVSKSGGKEKKHEKTGTSCVIFLRNYKENERANLFPQNKLNRCKCIEKRRAAPGHDAWVAEEWKREELAAQKNV